jgi:hypothetical protein
MPTRSELVAARLEEIAWDGRIARGRPAEVARELGVSRELVRQVMVRLELELASPAQPGVCATCGGPTRPGKSYCSPRCAGERLRRYHDVGAVCIACGTAFVWTAAAQQQRVQNARQGQIRRLPVEAPVCSRTCGHRVSVELRNRERVPKHGTVAEYRRGCRCGLCREANTAYARARRERAA